MYGWYIIKALKKTVQKFNSKTIYGFDVETYNNNKSFYCATIFGEGVCKTYMTKKDLISDILSGTYNDSIICATNLGFDFFAILFKSKGFSFILRGSDLLYAKTYIYNNSFNILRNHHKTCITFLDTMNYSKMSVEKLGKLVGVPKLKTPEFIGNRPKNDKEKEYMIKYNRRDAEISYLALNYFYDKFECLGATPKMTIASTSMSLFKNKYLKDTYFTHKIPVLDELFKAYYGGRCEAFSRGKIENYKYYDINSLYPSVMLDGVYPDSNTLRITRHNRTLRYIHCLEGVSDVTIYCPYMEYPLLPFRMDGKLKFPIGEWRGHYSHLELRRAVELGYTIKKVHKTWYYTGTCRPFIDFVRDLYEFRQNNPEISVVAKLIMNSLYGKFGQKYGKKIDILSVDATLKQLSACTDIERVNGYFIVKKLLKERAFCVPAWALYVTAYGRIKLHDYISRYHAVYCDTDSIITRSDLVTSKDIGKMKLEHTIGTGYIIKPKMYMIDNIVKVKGIGKRLYSKDFLRLMSDPRIQYKKFAKIRESIRRGFIPNEIIDVMKHLNLEDDKRVWKQKFERNNLQHSRPYKIGLSQTKDSYESHTYEIESEIVCKESK